MLGIVTERPQKRKTNPGTRPGPLSLPLAHSHNGNFLSNAGLLFRSLQLP